MCLMHLMHLMPRMPVMNLQLGRASLLRTSSAPVRLACLAALVLLALPMPAFPAQPGDSSSAYQDSAPEAATGRSEKPAVRAQRQMVVSADVRASRAGLAVLRQGGNAIDAAIATQFVLSVVEPQSSGIGGGGFLVFWQPALGNTPSALQTWDGRETAPRSASAERFLNSQGKPLRFRDAIGSGKSVGVPGLVAMLWAAHQAYGSLPWASLLQPAIELAAQGFVVSPRLATLIARDALLAASVSARTLYFSDTSHAGSLLRNPALAEVLQRIARDGPAALQQGEIAQDIVNAVRAAGGDMQLADLADYRAIAREALCADYRRHRLCGAPPPSSGTFTVGQLLGILEQHDALVNDATPPAGVALPSAARPGARVTRQPLATLLPNSAAAAHRYSEAARLAYADRDHYLADPAFVSMPLAALLAPAYLRQRAGLIDTQRSLGSASPGDPLPGASASLGRDATESLAATTHLSVMDAQGRAVALTASVESAFGSRILVRGFLLNNQLTDFSWLAQQDGKFAANRVQGGKRPRSSMAPLIVFGPNGQPRWLIGSPGGNQIINYVARTLVALIDWRMPLQQALALGHYGSRNRQTELEAGSEMQALAPSLRSLGHEVRIGEQTSGLNVIEVAMGEDGLLGAADPRREGAALGD